MLPQIMLDAVPGSLLLHSCDASRIHGRNRSHSKKPACHRQAKTAFGTRALPAQPEQAKAQTEPWLLAASPTLAELDAQAGVDLYSGRMPIEQSFREVKNPRWGRGLSLSQTTRPDRLAILLLIGAWAMFA